MNHTLLHSLWCRRRLLVVALFDRRRVTIFALTGRSTFFQFCKVTLDRYEAEWFHGEGRSWELMEGLREEAKQDFVGEMENTKHQTIQSDDAGHTPPANRHDLDSRRRRRQD